MLAKAVSDVVLTKAVSDVVLAKAVSDVVLAKAVSDVLAKAVSVVALCILVVCAASKRAELQAAAFLPTANSGIVHSKLHGTVRICGLHSTLHCIFVACIVHCTAYLWPA